jgi:hypothetical protein
MPGYGATSLQIAIRTPAEVAAGLRRVDTTAALLAGLGGTVYRREVFAGGLAQQLIELVDTGLNAGPNIVRSGGHFAFEGENVGPSYIFDIDVVAGLLATPVDGRLATVLLVPAEDCHDSGLAVRILA